MEVTQIEVVLQDGNNKVHPEKVQDLEKSLLNETKMSTLYFQKPELGKFINIKAIKPWDELVSSLHTSSDLKCHYVEEVT